MGVHVAKPIEVQNRRKVGHGLVRVDHLPQDVVDDRPIREHDLTRFDQSGEASAGAQID